LKIEKGIFPLKLEYQDLIKLMVILDSLPYVADMPIFIGLWHLCNTLHAMEKAGAVSS